MIHANEKLQTSKMTNELNIETQSFESESIQIERS